MNKYSDLIADRLEKNGEFLHEMWKLSKPHPHFYIDELLPETLVRELAENFPSRTELMFRNSIRESKYVGVEFHKYDPIMRDITFAFQAERVVKLIEKITGLESLMPDPTLYASGLSLMEKGDFLNPHLDNSHDGDRKHYRVLNLLYYCSPNWSLSAGGNLELWEPGIKNGHTIISKSNRLVVMKTNKHSWHSVSPVEVEESRRCISNYYFSKNSPDLQEYFHVTTFEARPGESLKGLILKVDGSVRNGIRRIFPKGIVKTQHRIENSSESSDH